MARGVGGTGDIKIARSDCYLTNLSIKIELDQTKVDRKYFYYKYLLSNLRYLDSGSAQSQITIKDLENLKFELPDLLTQKKISDVLSVYDDLIENNNRRIKILEEMAQKIYTEWFINFRFPGYEKAKFGKDGLPDGWEMKPIKDICSFISRGVSPKYSPGSGIYIINQKVNQGSFLSIKDLKELSSNLDFTKDKFARLGDVLINCLGEGTIGRTNFYNERHKNWAVDQHMSICRFENISDSLYLYFVLSSDQGQSKIASLKTGGTNMTMLNISSLRSFEVLLPPIKLRTFFSERILPFFEQKQIYIEDNRILSKSRDLLIPQLITGKRELK